MIVLAAPTSPHFLHRSSQFLAAPSASVTEEPGTSLIHTGRLLKGVVSGFSSQAVDSVRDLLTPGGLAMAAASTAILKFLPRWGFRLLGTAGTVYGVAALSVGLYRAFSDSTASAEARGRDVGKGLFYALPAPFFIKQRFNAWKASNLRERVMNLPYPSDHPIVSTSKDLRLMANRVRRSLARSLHDLPSNVQGQILKAYDQPVFVRSFSFGDAACSFRQIKLSAAFPQFPEYSHRQELAGFIQALMKYHEARHLKSQYLRYPKLFNYCNRYQVDQPLRLSGIFFSKPGVPRPPLGDTLRWHLYSPVRHLERLALTAEHRVVHRVGSNVNWTGTFARALAEGGSVRESNERVKLTWLMAILKQNLLLSRKERIWLHTVNSHYPRFRTLGGITDEQILKGAYLYAGLNEARHQVGRFLPS